MTLDFSPRPAAAPARSRVWAHASIEASLIVRNGEQAILAILIPLAVLFFLAITSVTRYRCPLVDRQGFPCVHRFTLHTDLEKHLEHGHGMAPDDARRFTAPSS